MTHPIKPWWPAAKNLREAGHNIGEIAKLLKVRRMGVQIALREMGLR
jgi:hypothetical protein